MSAEEEISCVSLVEGNLHVSFRDGRIALFTQKYIRSHSVDPTMFFVYAKETEGDGAADPARLVLANGNTEMSYKLDGHSG